MIERQPWMDDLVEWLEDNGKIVGIVNKSGEYVVCPSCDELVPRNEANEHVCPIEGLEDD